MGSLSYIFSQPEFIDGVGEIYPIKIKDYDKFSECSDLLYLSKNHYETNDLPLLVLLFMSVSALKLTEEELIKKLIILFSSVTKKDVEFISSENYEGFIVDSKYIISSHNYDIVREVVMKQNLIFEQKIYKNKIIQEWANKVIQSKMKSSVKITLEDIITTVKNFDGLTYEQVMEQTIYQTYADFYRIRKFKDNERDVIFRSVSDKWNIQDFAEQIDMFHNPYDDLFVNSSKLNNINSITK